MTDALMAFGQIIGGGVVTGGIVLFGFKRFLVKHDQDHDRIGELEKRVLKIDTHYQAHLVETNRFGSAIDKVENRIEKVGRDIINLGIQLTELKSHYSILIRHENELKWLRDKNADHSARISSVEGQIGVVAKRQKEDSA